MAQDACHGALRQAEIRRETPLLFLQRSPNLACIYTELVSRSPAAEGEELSGSFKALCELKLSQVFNGMQRTTFDIIVSISIRQQLPTGL